MQKKGQISLDLMLTVIVVLLLGTAFLTFRDEFIASERTTGIRAQETNIANDLLALINQAKMLDENQDSNFFVNYKVPFLFEPNKRGGQDCNIMIKRTNPTFIEISYYTEDLNAVIVIRDINFNFIKTADLNFVCGQTMVFDKENLGENA